MTVVASVVAVVMFSTAVALAKPLSEGQWKKQANAFCKQVNKDLDEIARQLFTGHRENEEPSAEQVTAWVEQFVPLASDAIASIDALREPKALKNEVKKFKAAVSDAVAAVESNPTGVFVGDNDPFAEADKIAKKLGLRECVDE